MKEVYQMDSTNALFTRTEMMLGAETLRRMAAARVILFGVGGVGSWCAEALIRSGVGHLTLVDSDCIEPTNINRQLPALSTTVGMPKVAVMRDRLLAVNPQADIVARQERYTPESAECFGLQSFDYVVDAIDSLKDKLNLILRATQLGVRFYSSMGAARKMDPLQVQVSEFWKVNGCPLAATLRKRMRKAGTYPGGKFLCVWSPERNEHSQPKGTLMPVTATFGLTLASLIIRDIAQQQV